MFDLIYLCVMEVDMEFQLFGFRQNLLFVGFEFRVTYIWNASNYPHHTNSSSK